MKCLAPMVLEIELYPNAQNANRRTKKTLMNRKELSELIDQELLDESKRIKLNPWLDAFLIGLLIGIIVYGVIINSIGLLAIIPLFLIYVQIKKSKKQKALVKLLK
jgi:hypothetical protein